jgi:hypothetical protein
MKRFQFLSVLLFALVAATNLCKASADTAKTAVNKNPAATVVSKKDSTPRVTGIQMVTASNDVNGKSKGLETGGIIAYPDEIIRFTISRPKAFLVTKPTDISHVVIYGNGLELKGMCTGWFSNVSRVDINAGHMPNLDTVAYIDIILRRDDTTQAAWNFFYSSGKNLTEHYADIHASIGWEGMSPLENASTVKTIRFYYYHDWIFWLWLSLFVIIITGFLILALKTDALRDGKGGPYSLSNTMLFFWTLLVVGGFIYTLVLTDVASAMNSSILLLLGVSMATSGGAAAIDLTSASKNPGAPAKPSQNFIKDILSDGNIFSIHRIQAFTWNLVLGLYFVIYTVLYKTMPVFSETLLFLAGISSLSYLGGKIPENSNNAATPTT